MAPLEGDGKPQYATTHDVSQTSSHTQPHICYLSQFKKKNEKQEDVPFSSVTCTLKLLHRCLLNGYVHTNPVSF